MTASDLEESQRAPMRQAEAMWHDPDARVTPAKVMRTVVLVADAALATWQIIEARKTRAMQLCRRDLDLDA